MLEIVFHEFYGRYGNLIKQLYKVSLSRMLNEILKLDQSVTVTSQPIRVYANWIFDIDTELGLYRNTRGFHGTIVTGVACQHGNAYPSEHLVPSLFGICAYCWYNFSQFCRNYLDFFTSNIPWYFFEVFASHNFTRKWNFHLTVSNSDPLCFMCEAVGAFLGEKDLWSHSPASFAIPSFLIHMKYKIKRFFGLVVEVL